jgi:HAD superfamily hydrolase (TIGR01490 family)
VNLTLFDLDHTLIAIDSDHGFGEFMVRLGWADAATHRARNDAFYADYLAGRLDQAAYIEFATAPWRDRPAHEAEAGRARFVREVIEPELRPPALDLVRRHREAGDTLAIVTSTNEFITRPIAERFGIETLIATELARDATGRATGAIRGVPAFREGKVVRLEQWLAARGQRRTDFERITFYSDSTNDLPLLEWSTHPVATNPSAALERIAAERGWPILRLFAPPTQ